ncbi:hypothetical protein KPL71_022141 [Citrus sinensis]|uniref:Uncharacterized protein n=1 Tax=Citrus sinensis TaxID=2711 RepID=A0ACB8JN39_CITSI|nr:hypothetical protein KPL71_022141 [Citrus sinensis]
MEKTPTESALVVIQSVQFDGVFNAGIILTTTNYDVWSQIMEMHLAEREKLSYIRSNTKPSEESSKEYEKLYNENQKVKRWLLISMSPEIMKRYLRIPTTYEIWDALSKAFYDGSDELQVFTLNQKAFSTKQNGQPLSKFYGELIEIFRELDHRDKVVMNDLEDIVIYRRSVERLRVHIFLAGLDEEFDQVHGEILRKDIIPDLEECYFFIRKEDVRQSKLNKKVDSEKKKCHTKEQCFEIIGYSDWWDTRKKNTKQELKTAVAESTSSTDLRKESSVQIATSVSLGYALHQKGYRCYHPPSRKIYITIDVIFHEDIMYYLSETKFQGEYNEEEIHPLTYLPPEEGQSSIEVVNLQDTGKENGDDSQAEISEDTFGEHNNSDTTAIENESHEEMPNQSSAEDVPTTSPIKIIIPQRQNRVNLDWLVQQFDVKNAFLHGDLSEEIYMDLPPGCSGPKQLNQKVYKLKKSLYGLKQSLRAWFGKFTKTMVLFWYNQSNSDHTLFIKKRQGKIIALIVYVDDMVSRSKGGIFLSQGKYALDLLHETGMTACQPIDTPIEERLKFCITSDQVPVDKGRYQSLIGRLMYLSHTRPDLAYALSVVSQFIHNPGEQHMKAVMRILRYLKTNPGKGILFSKNEDYSNIEVYTDANWVGSVSDRRSTSGYFTSVGFCFWKTTFCNFAAARLNFA